MTIDPEKRRECRELLILSLDGELSPEQNERLNALLGDRALRRYYLDFVELSQNLNEIHWPQFNASPVLDQSLWQLLAQHEKEAQAVVIPSEQPLEELVTDVRRRKAQLKSERKKVPASLWISLGSLAAVLMLLVYIVHRPYTPAQPVAVVQDCLDARWETPMEIGTLLYDKSNSYTLLAGYARLRLNTGVIVHLESPARIVFYSEDRMHLHYGRLVATVPGAALGFTVETPHCRIIDLGTEFGVNVSKSGNTDVQMFSGKASLVSSLAGRTLESLTLTQGQSRSIDTSGRISPVPFKPNGFVRSIHSGQHIAWRSEPIDLADIVGGGNGFGTGAIGGGISLTSGTTVSDFNWSDRVGTGQYLPVKELPFVDGVIVPIPQDGTLQVSSMGHLFRDCPDTNGLYFDEIRNGGVIRMTDDRLSYPMLFNGQVWGTAERPLLFMHANAAITFDLDAIRAAMPGFQVEAFRSRCVLIEKSGRIRSEKADVFVLIDGQAKFRQTGFDQEHTALNIDIPIGDNDRFLTLAVTDGDGSIAIDWVGFIEPYLYFEAVR